MSLIFLSKYPYEILKLIHKEINPWSSNTSTLLMKLRTIETKNYCLPLYSQRIYLGLPKNNRSFNESYSYSAQYETFFCNVAVDILSIC